MPPASAPLAAAAGPQCLAHPDWLYHTLTVSGPAAALAAFRARAAGAGVVPWLYDYDHMEEDWFHRLLAPPAHQRGISTHGARVLARQLREAVWAEHEHAVVGDDVLDFIASKVKENIRELEGALIRVTAYASLNRQLLTRDLAESVLADFVGSNQPRQITAQQIIEISARHFGFSVAELIGPSRRRPLVIARQIAMYLFRELTDFSYPAIGREFGDRDHTTVIHAVEKISGLMKERRQVYDQVTELSAQIKNGL